MRNTRTQNLIKKLLNMSNDSAQAHLNQILERNDGEYELFQYFDVILQSNPSDALRTAKILESSLNQDSSNSLTLSTHRLKAQSLRAMGNHLEAIQSYDFIRAYGEERALGAAAAKCLTGYIDSLGVVGRVQDACRIAESLFQILNAEGDSTEAANVMINLGNIQYRRDEFRAALKSYETADSLFTEQTEKKNQARLMANRANVLAQLHREEEAAELLSQAGSLFAECKMDVSVAMVQANEGYLHYISGRHIAALSLLNKARIIFQLNLRQFETAKCDADVAEVYRELNLLSESAECASRAVQTFEALNMPYEQARALLTLASVSHAMNLSEQSLEYLDRAGALFQALGNQLNLAISHLMIAWVQHKLGSAESVSVSLNSAIAGFKRTKSREWLAEAELFEMEISDSLPSDELRLKRIIKTAKWASRPWLLSRTERLMGQRLFRSDNLNLAIRHLRSSVSALEVMSAGAAQEDVYTSFIADKLGIYEDLVLMLLKRGKRADTAEALQVVEKARSRMLLEKLQSSLNTERIGSEFEADGKNIDKLRAELSRAFHRVHTAGADNPQRKPAVKRDNLARLRFLELNYKKALLDRDINHSIKDDSALLSSKLPTAAAIQSVMTSDECLIEYFTAGDQIGAFIVNNRGISVVESIAAAAEIEHCSRRLRYHMHRAEIMESYDSSRKESMLEDLGCLLQKLYNLILRPVLTCTSKRKLVVILHGVLHGIPIHALHDGSRYVLDNFEIRYAPSASAWYMGRCRCKKDSEKQRKYAANTSLLMAIPSPGIEQVTKEVDNLAKNLNRPVVFHGNKATIKAFHENAPNCNILHIAAHAVFREDSPLFSAIKFADGWLMARDLYDITLGCDLATLSACRTGSAFIAPGDEIYGLARGFLFAGAKSLAVSLWPADDVSTSVLMPAFYGGIQQGKSISESMREAQLQTRKQYPHPYHWAPFIIIGER